MGGRDHMTNGHKIEKHELFEELMIYKEIVFQICLGYSRNPWDAEDLTQETFIRLFKSINSDYKIKNSKAWLYRVASNLCINQIKRANTFRYIVKNRIPSEHTVYSSETDYLKKEEIDLVRKTVEKLSLRDRVLLQLYQDGLSYADMAELVNVNKNSVGNMLSRAIDGLYAFLREEIKQ